MVKRIEDASSPRGTSRHVLRRPRRHRVGVRRTAQPRRSRSSAIWFITTAVLATLQAKGIAVARTIRREVKTHTVMVTAHGASERTLAKMRALGLESRRSDLPARRCGAPGHQDARRRRLSSCHRRPARPRGGAGLDRRPRDLRRRAATSAMCCSSRNTRASALPPRPRSRSTRCVTWSALIRRRFPQSDVRFIDTVCQPTKQRQSAAIDLARQCDVVIVVGGENSNNTRELVNTCRHHCSHVHHIQTESDLRSEWFVGAGTVGVTAGTSTPDDVIDRVERRLRALAAEPSTASHTAASHP